MFKLIKTVRAEDLGLKELSEFLDARFQPEISATGIIILNKDAHSQEELQQRWGVDFLRDLPREDHELLFYLTKSTTGYYNQNLIGRICLKYVWHEFFRAFPLGCILLVQLSEEWLTIIWQGQKQLAHLTGYATENRIRAPQDMSGLQAENFPFNVLPIASSGIYPLTFLDFAYTSSNLVFIYIPDRAITHAQMLEKGAYVNVVDATSHL